MPTVHPTDGPSDEQLRKSAALFAAVGKMKEKFLVDTFAMRCWPEFIADDLYGIAVCSTIGHLTNHGFLTACEGDAYGAVMMRMAQELTGELPFFCDMIIMGGGLWRRLALRRGPGQTLPARLPTAALPQRDRRGRRRKRRHRRISAEAGARHAGAPRGEARRRRFPHADRHGRRA